MAISKKMEAAFNQQINAEMYSANLYLAMAAHFEEQDLPGFANWMRVQVKEEDFHAQKIFDFVVNRSGRVTIDQVDKPPATWDSPLAVFQAAYEHELKVSRSIHDLVGLAVEERDRASESFLRWFVDEQVEEEASVDRLVKMLRMSEGQPAAMLMMDRDLATRTFVPPASGGDTP